MTYAGPKGGEQIADIVADWEAGRCGPHKAMMRIKEHLDALTFQPGNDLHIGYEAGMKLAKSAAPQPAPAIDLEQFLALAMRWEERYSPVPGCRATAGALDATQDCAAELRALIYDLSKSPYGELRPHDLVVESWPPRTGFQLSQPRGIKLTHKPTGTVVTCDTERSQHANRDRALEMMRIKLQLTKREGGGG